MGPLVSLTLSELEGISISDTIPPSTDTPSCSAKREAWGGYNHATLLRHRRQSHPSQTGSAPK
jgi:hypothetical protein